MKTPGELTPGSHLEDAWRSLWQRLQWTDGFALIFVFVSDSRPLVILRDRLERATLDRGEALERLAPDSPGRVVEQVMETVRNAANLQHPLSAPLWVELQDGAGDAAWHQARIDLLQRLNEHRERLRKKLRRPFILTFPSTFRPHVRQFAPDLWAIREIAMDLDSAAPDADADLGPGGEATTPSLSRAAGGGGGGGEAPTTSLSPAERSVAEAALKEWDRLLAGQQRGRSVIVAGWRASAEASKLGQSQRADDIAREVLAMARRAVDNAGRAERPGALRDLQVSIETVSQTARNLGRTGEAEAALRESLALRRTVRPSVVFISSTIEDLKEYRAAARDAVLAAGFQIVMQECSRSTLPSEGNFEPRPVFGRMA